MNYIFLYPVIAAALLLFLFLRIVVYRLYAHPLARFPGPKLAAATFFYEFYYDVIRGGMYIWEIERMHEKYGPIVRINPRELHIKDPYYYEEIHASSTRKRNRDPKYAVAFGAPYSLVGTINHDHHKLRRSFIQNYFSKRSVTNLTPYIWEKVDRLLVRFEGAYTNNAVLHMQLDFAALTADVITQYCYGWSYGYLDDPKNATRIDLVDAVGGLMNMFHINRFFPILVTIFRTAPPSIVRFLQPQMGDLFDVKARLREQAIATLADKKSELERGKEFETVFDALVGPNVPDEEKSIDRLVDESALLLGAGTETTARSLAVSMFHVMSNKDIEGKLRDELMTVLEKPTSKATLAELEQLPYLTGVVNEGLRLSHGMTARLSRMSPVDPMRYKDWTIPPGTPVSQSNYFVHMDPTLFPDPEKFDPERWTRAAEKGEHLSRFIVAFTKGSKQCLGINLAYAEIYMTLAHIVRRFEFAPYETTAENISVRRSLGTGVPMDRTFDVRAKVLRVLEE